MQIDWWTLTLQAINFLILVWLLNRYLYRPVLAVVARRQEAANKLLADAEAERARAQSERTEIAQIRNGLEVERTKAIEQAQIEVEALRETLMVEANANAAKLLDDAKTAAMRAAALSERTLSREAERLAVTIAGKLLARVRLENPAAAFLAPLCDKIRELPALSKVALQNARTLKVTTATPLTRDQKKLVEQILADCIGSKTEFVFDKDPTLIAGIELTSHDIALRNSWRDDLRAIRTELSREDTDYAAV